MVSCVQLEEEEEQQEQEQVPDKQSDRYQFVRQAHMDVVVDACVLFCSFASLSPLASPCRPKPAAAAGSFNFWGVANSLAETVKRGTADLATTVRETDWREEIRAFGKDVLEETEELGQTAVSAVEHAAVSAVEHVEHLPQHVRVYAAHNEHSSVDEHIG